MASESREKESGLGVFIVIRERSRDEVPLKIGLCGLNFLLAQKKENTCAFVSACLLGSRREGGVEGGLLTTVGKPLKMKLTLFFHSPSQDSFSLFLFLLLHSGREVNRERLNGIIEFFMQSEFNLNK